MKKLFKTLLCVIAILTICSCDSFKEKEDTQMSSNNTTTIEGISPEIRNKFATQDTLMNALVLKVDTLAQALTLAQKANAELKGQMEKLESPKRTWSYMTLASFILAIIAFILSLLKKGVSREKIDDIFSYNLDKSKRIAELKVAVNQLQFGLNSNKASQSKNISLQELYARLISIESELSRMSRKQDENHNTSSSSNSHHQEQFNHVKEQDFIKMRYANINSGKNFTKIFDSPQESCVFSIKLKSASKGEFNIISLDKIKSRNMWQEIVDYTGSIEDATSFTVEEYGICEQYDDVTWQITKKLKIKLLK